MCPGLFELLGKIARRTRKRDTGIINLMRQANKNANTNQQHQKTKKSKQQFFCWTALLHLQRDESSITLVPRFQNHVNPYSSPIGALHARARNPAWNNAQVQSWKPRPLSGERPGKGPCGEPDWLRHGRACDQAGESGVVCHRLNFILPYAGGGMSYTRLNLWLQAVILSLWKPWQRRSLFGLL